MKFTSKSKFRAIAVLFLALAVTVSCALWSVFGRRGNGMEALANTSAAEIANALNNAAADWKTQTSVRVGDTSKSDEDGKGDDGCVVTISQAKASVSSVVIPSGAQVTVDPIAPSVQRELENIATYTQIIFEVPVTVQAEAVLTLNADVVFCDEVTVEGTLIINGMAFNQGAMQVSNANNTHAEIKSEGVIVNGSLNNDAAREGSISIAAGATLTIGSGSGTEYADGTAAPDGGALFLKANTSNALGITITDQGKLINGGSVIYDENAGAPSVSGEGVVQSAGFINELPANNTDTSKTYVFYPDPNATGINGVGTSLALSNDSTKTWSNITLLSFGRTVITNSGINCYYTLNNVNLGGGTINVDLGGGTSGGTFTQGANELIFDGGANYTADGNLLFLLGNDSTVSTGYTVNNTNSSSLFNINGGDSYISNIYKGVKVTHNAKNGQGGGITVNSNANLNVFGGNITYNSVVGVSQGTAGGGMYIAYNATVNVYSGKISYNALASAGTERCASGAGVGVHGADLNIYGGEISFNHGASGNGGSNNLGADGGGIQGHIYTETDRGWWGTYIVNQRHAKIVMYGGKISNNWTGGYGGGVALWDSDFTMSGGEVSGNEAAWGGGICVNGDAGGYTEI